jgi:hypothetical protein
MPCNTVTLTQVQLDKNTNTDILHAALDKLGLNPVRVARGIAFSQGEFDKSTGVMTLQGSRTDARTADIKRTYSGQIIVTSAKRAGWQVKEVAKDKYQVVKRF